MTIQTPDEGEKARPKSTGAKQHKASTSAAATGGDGFVYVRKDRKEGEEDSKPARRQNDRPPKPAAPLIFSENHEGSPEISKMRLVVKRVWN